MPRFLHLFALLPLAAVAQDIHVPDALSGRFTQQKEIQQAGLTLRSAGSFSIIKGKGIKWAVESPVKSTIVLCPGTALGEAEVAKQIAAIMQALLLQDYNALSKYFDVERAANSEGFEIRLKTTDGTLAKIFSEIVIKGDKYIKTVALFNQQGDLTTIAFTDLREMAEQFSCDE